MPIERARVDPRIVALARDRICVDPGLLPDERRFNPPARSVLLRRPAMKSSLRFVLLASPMLLAACSSAGGGENLGTSDEALSRRHVDRVTTISYAPNSFVIGNAYPGWTDEVQGDPQFSSGPGNPHGASYRWGFLFGENFDRCAWINDADVDSDGAGRHPGARCGSPQQIDTPYFVDTFTNGVRNDLVGDGSDTNMHYTGSGCTDTNGYGNVAPWRVPATPANRIGQIPDGRLLKWRYVSKDGDWVLVRDPTPGMSPNWYFVQRGCVSLVNKN